MSRTPTTTRKRKTQKNFRFRDPIIALLEKLHKRTGKTQTRILEDALVAANTHNLV